MDVLVDTLAELTLNWSYWHWMGIGTSIIILSILLTILMNPGPDPW